MSGQEQLHFHSEDGQLKWESRGVGCVRTPRGVFVLRPSHAVWVPSGNCHGSIYSAGNEEHGFYLNEALCTRLPSICCAVRITPDLREAISYFLDLDFQNARRTPNISPHLAAVYRDVVDATIEPLPIQIPSESPVQPAIDTLFNKPALNRPLDQWAELLDMSPRTFSRSFHQSTGLSFGNWRKRVRLLYALRRLAADVEVATVADELGYRPSGFVAMFRKELDTTPGRYFGERDQ